MSFKEYNQDQPSLLPPTLHDFLSEGHLAHVIKEVINELDLEGPYAPYSDLGCSAYHIPVFKELYSNLISGP